MGVIADMILAVAVIAVAFGTVTEFQLRIGHICPSANCAAVGVGDGLLFAMGGIAVGEGDRTGFLLGLCGSDCPIAAGSPCRRQQIQYILTGKQQEICESDQWKQIGWEQVYRVGHVENLN